MPQTEIKLHNVGQSSSTIYRYDANRLLMDIVGKKLKDFNKNKIYKKGDLIYRRDGDTFIFYKANKDIPQGNTFNPADWVKASDEDKSAIIGSGSGGTSESPVPGVDYLKGYNHSERTKLGVESCVRRVQDYGISKYRVTQLTNPDIKYPIKLTKDNNIIEIQGGVLYRNNQDINAIVIHIDYDFIDKNGMNMARYTNPENVADYIEKTVDVTVGYFSGTTKNNAPLQYTFEKVTLDKLNHLLITSELYPDYMKGDRVFESFDKITIKLNETTLLGENMFIIHNIFFTPCIY